MLDRQSYLIRERIGMFNYAGTYDIFDPDTEMQIGITRTELGFFFYIVTIIVFILDLTLRSLSLSIPKRNMPIKVIVYAGKNPKDESKRLFSIERGFNLFRAKINICDHKGKVLGYLQNKLMTIGCSFYVFDAAGRQIAFVKGDFLAWNFDFLDRSGEELGTINKEWAGIGKELLTSADNYVISFHQHPSPAQAALLLAAGLAVDTFYKQ